MESVKLDTSEIRSFFGLHRGSKKLIKHHLASDGLMVPDITEAGTYMRGIDHMVTQEIKTRL